MNTELKNCSVLLNRNFYENETTLKINYSPTVELKKIINPPSRREVANSKSKQVQVAKEKNESTDYTTDSSPSDDEEMTEKQSKTKYSISISNPKKLKCMLCDKAFSSHPSYLVHKRSHASRPFKCIVCAEYFEYRQTFISHMKTNHPERKPFPCEYPGCNKSFNGRKQQEIHHKQHWRYMCKYCKKPFLRKYHMRSHVMKIH